MANTTDVAVVTLVLEESAVEWINKQTGLDLTLTSDRDKSGGSISGSYEMYQDCRRCIDPDDLVALLIAFSEAPWFVSDCCRLFVSDDDTDLDGVFSVESAKAAAVDWRRQIEESKAAVADWKKRIEGRG